MKYAKPEGAKFTERIKACRMTRRGFNMLAAGAAAISALPGCSPSHDEVEPQEYDLDAVINRGVWKTATCVQDCGGKCLNKALVADGVVIRQKTDDTHPDSQEYPQSRACARGRAKRMYLYSADRIKYPMKRKNWSPGGGANSNGHLRGADEWERISWTQALDYVAAEIKRVYDNYGPTSLLVPGLITGVPHMAYGGAVYALSQLGGYTSMWDTGSFGSYEYAVSQYGLPFRGQGETNDRLDLVNADTIVLYGNNISWSAPGNPAWHFKHAKNRGVKFISVGPDNNTTAALLGARWIRVYPGTDIAFLLGVAYTMIQENLHDQNFLNKYTVGFDSPAGDNFKDYVLGTHDATPKNTAWASKRCGTPEEDIKWFAREIAKDKKVMLLHGYAAARNSGVEDLPQMFMTVAVMGGHAGKSGHAFGGYYSDGCADAGNHRLVLNGTSGMPGTPNPVTESIVGSQIYDAILNGEYTYFGSAGYLEAPQVRQIDIRGVFTGSMRNFLHSTPNLNKGIAAMRKLEFVFTRAFVPGVSAMYSDIILPLASDWEQDGYAPYDFHTSREMALIYSKVREPYYESKTDQWIMTEILKRFGADPAVTYPFGETQQWFNIIAGARVIKESGGGYDPLVTITREDIDRYGVEGTPQQGRISFGEYVGKGIFQLKRSAGDNYGYIGYGAFISDPVNNPLPSASGKFEIDCPAKATTLNTLGLGSTHTFKPYPTYRSPVEGYETAFSDFDRGQKGQYPYVIFNPHYLRAANSNIETVRWLHEIWTLPFFISAKDAKDKGIRDGDTVLVFNGRGKILRKATVTESLMPGVVALPNNGVADIDPVTGIDRGGCANSLTGIVLDSMGVTGYNTVNCDFERYEGKPLQDDYLKPYTVLGE